VNSVPIYLWREVLVSKGSFHFFQTLNLVLEIFLKTTDPKRSITCHKSSSKTLSLFLPVLKLKFPSRAPTTNPSETTSTPTQQAVARQTGGRRLVPVHQSRIPDRPVKVGEKDSNIKIKIELDLEVEVEIYARVKGDVMIGLM
jgi:hypothetical protein